MTVIISAALRAEVLAAAREKHPSAVANLTDMYRKHAKEAARSLRLKLTEADFNRIDQHVEAMLRLD